MFFLTIKSIFGCIASFYCGFYVIWMSLLGHKLKYWYKTLDPVMQNSLNAASLFQIFHGIAIFIVVFSLSEFIGCNIAAILIPSFFALGVLFFSFSLYLRAFFPMSGKFSLITPLGGIFLILGWGFLLLRMLIISYNAIILKQPATSCTISSRMGLQKNVQVEDEWKSSKEEEYKDLQEKKKGGCCSGNKNKASQSSI